MGRPIFASIPSRFVSCPVLSMLSPGGAAGLESLFPLGRALLSDFSSLPCSERCGEYLRCRRFVHAGQLEVLRVRARLDLTQHGCFQRGKQAVCFRLLWTAHIDGPYYDTIQTLEVELQEPLSPPALEHQAVRSSGRLLFDETSCAFVLGVCLFALMMLL